MTTLNAQIVLLEKQLKLNLQAEDARYILGEYEAIRAPLSNVDSSLRRMYERYMVLQNLPEDAPEKVVFSAEIKEAANSALFVLQAFAERWQHETHGARQGNDLVNAIQSLKNLSFTCGNEVERCWESWVEHLKSYVTLEDARLQTQKNIPGQEDTYTAFVKTRKRFQELVVQFPESSDSIDELHRLSAKMYELKGKMQFDLPDDVAFFFKELDSLNLRVSLGVLTPSVFDWLRSHNLLCEYVVSRKGRN